MEVENKPAFKVESNKVYYVSLTKKFGEYDNKYGKSYGYNINMRANTDDEPTDETFFASEAVKNLIEASRVGYDNEFELILNEKDGKKFYTLDGRTTNQWLANKQNEDAEKPSMSVEDKVQKGQDELDALFGEVTNNEKQKLMLLKSELTKCLKLVDELL